MHTSCRPVFAPDNRLLLADEEAGLAAVAIADEHCRLARRQQKGVETTGPDAVAAGIAAGGIDFRDGRVYLFRIGNLHGQDDPGIGVVDVPIDQRHPESHAGNGGGQIDGDRGFADSAFAAGDADDRG